MFKRKPKVYFIASHSEMRYLPDTKEVIEFSLNEYSTYWQAYSKDCLIEGPIRNTREQAIESFLYHVLYLRKEKEDHQKFIAKQKALERKEKIETYAAKLLNKLLLNSSIVYDTYEQISKESIALATTFVDQIDQVK